MSNRFRLWRIALVIAIVGGLLSVAGLTLAQSSSNYDLGCWGTMTSGGGERQSGAFLLRDATGQTAVGQANSGQYTLRTGYVQNWATLQGIVISGAGLDAPAATPAISEESDIIFLPIIKNVIRTVRPCSF